MNHTLEFGSSGIVLSSAENKSLAVIFDNFEDAMKHPAVQEIISTIESEVSGTNANLNGLTVFQMIWSKVREENTHYHFSREVYNAKKAYLENTRVLARLVKVFNNRRKQRRTQSSRVQSSSTYLTGNSGTPTPMMSPRTHSYPAAENLNGSNGNFSSVHSYSANLGTPAPMISPRTYSRSAEYHVSNVNSSSYYPLTAHSQAPAIPSHQQTQYAHGSSNTGYLGHPSPLPEASYDVCPSQQYNAYPDYPSSSTSYPSQYPYHVASASYYPQQSHYPDGNQFADASYNNYSTHLSQNYQFSDYDNHNAYYGSGGYPNHYQGA
ncbi:hypothetical protein D9757_002382 [Collybiopsis confluens]|uniref:Uncharacterized protein n=1 Tax=Collybiopsis confluens TaxID=2823264 RepID=A0A8H5MF01_9AGAR|nr:hypothetical protein D9757_002382 [Collybiopsis confluens]